MNESQGRKAMQAKTAPPKRDPKVSPNNVYLDNRMKGDFKFSISDYKTWLFVFAALSLFVVGIWGIYLILPSLLGVGVFGFLVYDEWKQNQPPAIPIVDNDSIIYNQTSEVSYLPFKDASETLKAIQPVSVQDITLDQWKMCHVNFYLMRFRLKKKSLVEIEDEAIAFAKVCLQRDLMDSLASFGFDAYWNGMPMLMLDDIKDRGNWYMITVGYINNPHIYRYFQSKNAPVAMPKLQVKDQGF